MPVYYPTLSINGKGTLQDSWYSRDGATGVCATGAVVSVEYLNT